jgi:Zn-finger nucleic acid-binding protein
MTYRDAPMLCPHCGEELAEVAPDRAKWRCRSCGGILVGAEELEREVAPHGEVILDTITGIRDTRPCPLCHEAMTAYVLYGIEIDRCGNDGGVWFDRGELGRARQEVPGAFPLVDSILA